jgi:hypothetical protein
MRERLVVIQNLRISQSYRTWRIETDRSGYSPDDVHHCLTFWATNQAGSNRCFKALPFSWVSGLDFEQA